MSSCKATLRTQKELSPDALHPRSTPHKSERNYIEIEPGVTLTSGWETSKRSLNAPCSYSWIAMGKLALLRYPSESQVPERVSTQCFLALIVGNSKSNHLGAQGTFKDTKGALFRCAPPEVNALNIWTKLHWDPTRFAQLPVGTARYLRERENTKHSGEFKTQRWIQDTKGALSKYAPPEVNALNIWTG